MFNRYDIAINYKKDLYNIKQLKKRITFLLNFDVSNAFDNVLHIRLLHNIKNRQVFTCLLK